MVKSDALARKDIVHIIAYPSCEDCLSWGDEIVAVAAGQNVYLLKNDASISTASTWSSQTLRVDQFTEQEWPEAPLSTVRGMSIGEEQSDSVVVALDFSPPGLGIHRRSVLALLTSNLTLAIWETDGSQRGWRRTGILNLLLREALSVDRYSEIGQKRDLRRIRAFAWCHPLKAGACNRWGLHYMTLVDDDGFLYFFKLAKANPSQYGTWTISSLSAAQIRDFQDHSTTSSAVTTMTSLQQAIIQSPPIKKIEIQPWVWSHQGEQYTEAAAEVMCIRSASQAPIVLAVAVSSGGNVRTGIVRASRTLSPSEGNSMNSEKQRQDGALIFHCLTDVPLWRGQLSSICTEFDKSHHLGGLYRIRFWGEAQSPDRSIEATCVSLHPRDSYEYSSAVHEKSYVLFRSLKPTSAVASTAEKTSYGVLEKVLTEVLRLLAEGRHVHNSIDMKLLHILRAWSSVHADNARQLLEKELESAYSRSMKNGATALQAATAQTTESSAMQAEICEICTAIIAFDDNVDSAVCDAGHVFNRCKLSLLAIQEPGITKSCSWCSRQFLNIAKLELGHGLSLTDHIFDFFDTCPYCGGKYTG